MSPTLAGEVDTVVMPHDDPDPASATRALGSGARVGRYKIQGVLGEGGMGVVYDAYDPQLRRSIALKILPARRRSSEGAQKRLVREAQSMARVNHPNVVTVHDVGLCPAGVYVAMDRIEGTTLGEWVEQHDPPSPAIVAVFGQVLEGLLSVHAAGLVHRDIKPANIMVGDFDSGRPRRVILMDFGLARDPIPTTQRSARGLSSATDSDSLTQTGVTVGTPLYMAPEQFVGGLADELSDQFSLCVSLYEALYRSRPFAGRSAQAIALAASQGQIAPPPSTSPAVPASIRRVLVRGLAPQREDRWPTLDAFALALRRAARPSGTPRRMVALAGVLGAAVWGLGAVVSTPSTPDCAEGRSQIDRTWTDTRAHSLNETLAGDDRLHSTRERVTAWRKAWRDAYDGACEAHGDGEDPIALDRRLHCLERQRQGFAAVSGRWSGADVGADDIVAAVAKFPRPHACLDSPGRPIDPVDATTLRALEQTLARATAAMQAGDYARARSVAADVLDAAHSAGARGLEAEARFELGYVQLLVGQFDASDNTLEVAYWAALAVDDPMLAARIASALTYLNVEELSRLEVAEEWLRHAQAQIKRAGGGQTEVAAEMWTHAALLASARQRFDEAEMLYRRTIDLHAELFGPQDVHGAAAHHNLGALYLRLRRLDESEAMYERALLLREGFYGPQHPDVASSLVGLGNLVRTRGQLDRASELYDRALKIRERSLGPGHPRTLAVINGVGIIESMRGNHKAAIATMRMLAERTEQTYGPEHPTTGGALDNLGLALSGGGHYEEAARYHADAMERLQRALGPDHIKVAGSARSLGAAYVSAGHFAEAVEPLRRAIAIRRQQRLEVTTRLQEELLLLASARIETGDPAEAIVLASEAVALRSSGAAAGLAEAQFTLAEARWAADERRPAVQLARSALRNVDEDPQGDAGLRAAIETWLAEKV